jgi:hypothetical protein
MVVMDHAGADLDQAAADVDRGVDRHDPLLDRR